MIVLYTVKRNERDRGLKRTVSFVLAVIMILAAVCGCGGETAETVDITEGTRAETVTDAQTAAETDNAADTSGAETETGNVDETTEAQAVDPAEVKIGGAALSDFSVVVAADAPSGVQNAAEDLCRLVEFASGIKLPIVNEDAAQGHSIILGETPLDCDAIKAARGQVKDDGYALVEDSGNLYISGVISRGTMNGVYDFLQDYLGVRFYSDTFTHVRGEYVKDVPAGQKTVYNPVFPGRYNWCVSGEVNNQRFAKRTKSTSIKYAGSHNLGSLSKTGDGVSKQPCLSDPKVFDTVFENLCKQIEKKPTKTFFHINQNDGGAFCKCAECTAKNEAAGGTAMGSLLIFINKIAAAVKEKYPDREIDILTYAYKETTICPDPSYVVPADNVIIVLCMMDSSCFTHAYNDPECEHNKKAYENMVNWSKVCKKLAVYDYTYNFASTEASVGPNIDIMRDNFQAFKACGLIGLLLEGDHMSETGEFAELRNYLLNRLMWNPDMTKAEFDKIRAEFMEDYYGAAAPYISEYIDLMNSTSRRTGLTAWDGHTSVYTDPSVFYAPKVDGKSDFTVINKCKELWDAAYACTLTDEELAHVEKSSIHYYFFLSKYAQKAYDKSTAKKEYQALCDKYTYNYDGKLPGVGNTDLPADKASEELNIREAPDGTLYVCGTGEFTDGMLVIPAENDGKKVVSVGKSAFARADNLVEVHVPEGITYIGAYAFRGCKNLKTVYLPASLQTLGFGALGLSGDEHYGCDSLSDIYYAGTVQQWQTLYETNNGAWKTLKNCAVHCADADIEIPAE